MRIFRVLISYPPTPERQERSRAVFLGELKVGELDGMDAMVDAYGDMLKLLKKINKGKDVVKEDSLSTFDTITLKNGVIIYLDTDPAEPLETWLKHASLFNPSPDKPQKK